MENLPELFRDAIVSGAGKKIGENIIDSALEILNHHLPAKCRENIQNFLIILLKK